MSQNLYEVLGVSKTDSHDTIKKAYRKLARETHPDRNKDNPKAEARFKEIGSAWDVLGDEDKRKMYDQFGDASTRPGFDADRARAYSAGRGGRGMNYGGETVDLGDLLGGMFSGGGGGRGGGFNRGFGAGAQGFGGSGFGGGFGPTPGQDQQVLIAIDFATAVLGGEHAVNLSDGRSMTVRIPEGVREGETLRLRGKGGRGTNGARNGDLRIQISIDNHPTLRREDLDLIATADITAVQAVRGDKITVSTLSGDVRITVPPNAQSGQKLRLTGKGVRRKDTRGDMFVELRIVLPEQMSDELLELLAAAYEDSPQVA